METISNSSAIVEIKNKKNQLPRKELLFIAIIFIIMLLVSIRIAIENTRQIKTVHLNAEQQLVVDYPTSIFVDEKPAEMFFSLHGTPPMTQTLIVSLTIPSGLVLVSPAEQSRAFIATVEFVPTTALVQSHSLEIMNARTVWCLGVREKLPIQTSVGKQGVLEIGIEGVLSVIARNSLVPTGLLGGILTIITLGRAEYQNWKNQKREQEVAIAQERLAEASERRAEATERRKQAEDKRQEAQEQKNQAEKGQTEFCEFIRGQNIENARETLNALEKLSAYAGNHSDIARMHYLLALTDGDIINVPVESLAATCPDETASAILYALAHNPVQTDELRHEIRKFPLDKLSREQQQMIEDARAKIAAGPEQPRGWPLLLEPLRRNSLFLRGAVGRRLGSVNPFPFEHAGEEVDLLFSREGTAFWNKHSIWKLLNDTNAPQVIYGAPGTGKTAFALALGEYLHTTDTLACYLTGLPEWRDIQIGFARKLLKFIHARPTWLSLLGQDERNLLACLCASALSPDLALAEIEVATFEQNSWLNQATNDTQKHDWEIAISTQLRLFKQAIKESNTVALSDEQWLFALIRCARSLKFSRIRVVIDAPSNGCTRWIEQSIIPQLDRWTDAGLILKLFVPAQVSETISISSRKSENELLHWLELGWQPQGGKSPLTDMVRWRYEQTARQFNIRIPFEEVIPINLLNKMLVSAKFNPRCFIRLWNQMISSSPDGMFTEELLRQAEKQVACP